MNHLAALNHYFWRYKWRFLWGIFFVAISNYFRVLQPQTIRYALDLIVENFNSYQLYNGFALQDEFYQTLGSTLLYFGGLVLLFAVLMGVFMYFMRQTLIVMSHLIVYDLRNAIFEQYQQLTLAFYKRNKTGDLMARITEDVNKVRMYLGPAIMYAVNLVVMFIMVIYAMIQVSPTLTMYSLIPLPFLSISIYYVNRIINKKSEQIQKQLSKLNSLAQEVFSGVRVVKSYVQEDSMTAVFAEESEEYKRRNLSLAQIDAIFRPLTLMLIGTSTIITIYVGGVLTMDGSITAGNIAEFVIYINMLTWPVTSIGWVASIIQQAAASQKRLNEFLSIQPDIAPPIDGKIYPLDGSIEFRDVTFTYPDTGIQALQHVSFSVRKGEKIAIIGRTGSGKTTIADLLLRMYDPSAGQILVDNKDIRQHDLATIRQQIGYVPQDVFLFSDTIANNINFSSAEATQNEVEEYAKYASIHNEIMDLPNGFETVVGERGVTLSGGQKQRISIARALIKQPDIIILDDCLSAVDTKTETHIANYLNELCADKTTIVITHRLYGALRFDKIIVLDKGEIVQIGTHDELMKQAGYYAEMYEKQRLEHTE